MKFNVKIFIVLALMGIVAALLILPYIYELTGDLLEEAQQQLGLDGTHFNVVIILQSSLMYVIAALIGVLLYRRAGFRMPVLEKYIGKEDISVDWRSWLFFSVAALLLIKARSAISERYVCRTKSAASAPLISSASLRISGI